MERKDINECKRIVIKIGTTSLTYDNGHVNLNRIGHLTRVISDLMNRGKEVILVSSGAIGVGVDQLKLEKKPATISGRQAVAAVGQCKLMHIYETLFSDFSQNVAQVLLTRDVMEGEKRTNAENTFDQLLNYGVVPIVNENDTVSVDEIKFGDNDFLSYVVSTITNADLLIILTDVDGLYDDDPRTNENAKLSETFSMSE